jgi:hypothetical protein
MELKFFKTAFLLFSLSVMLSTLNAQALANGDTSEKPPPSSVRSASQTHNYALRRLVRNSVGYLQIVEDDVVFLQIVEDDVVFMKSIIDNGIKIRRLNKNNQKTVEFVKGTTVLKSIVEDDVVFLKSIVEDDVVFLKSIVEDDVVFLETVKNTVDFSNSKDNTNPLKPNSSPQINVDSLKKLGTDSLRQVRRDSLKRANAVKHWSLGISGGLVNVPGFDLAYKFRSHWTARLGYGYLDYGVTNYKYDIKSTDAAGVVSSKTFSISAAAHLSNISGLIEYGIGPKGRFRLIGGAAYFPQKNFTASGEMLTEFELSAVTLRPADLGSGGIEVGFAQKISPYVGFGIGRTTPRRRLNLSLDFGAYYMGDYRIKINVNPGIILKENEENGPVIEKNLNANFLNKILPSGNLRLAYRLH